MQSAQRYLAFLCAFSWLPPAVFAAGCADADSAPPAVAAPLYDDDAAFLVEFPTDDAPAITVDPNGDPAEVSSVDGSDGTPDSTAAIDTATSPLDAAPQGACADPLVQGDLVIDELVIASVAGTGDYGEWPEVRSTLGCAASLQRLHRNARAEPMCPRST
jgi:hypothetical protein